MYFDVQPGVELKLKMFFYLFSACRFGELLYEESLYVCFITYLCNVYLFSIWCYTLLGETFANIWEIRESLSSQNHLNLPVRESLSSQNFINDWFHYYKNSS